MFDSKVPYPGHQLYTREQANHFVDGAGIMIPKGFFYLDFDDDTAFSKFLTIMQTHSMRTHVVYSDRGGHV